MEKFEYQSEGVFVSYNSEDKDWEFNFEIATSLEGALIHAKKYCEFLENELNSDSWAKNHKVVFKIGIEEVDK